MGGVARGQSEELLRLLPEEPLLLPPEELLRLSKMRSRMIAMVRSGLGRSVCGDADGLTRVARVVTKGGGSKASASSSSLGSAFTRIADCLTPWLFRILSIHDCMVESCLQHLSRQARVSGSCSASG